MKDIFNSKFSNHFKGTLKTSADFAWELNDNTIDSEHLLYGLMSQKGSIGAELFGSLKLNIDKAKKIIADISISHNKAGGKPEDAKNIIFSNKARDIIQKSIKIAFANKHKFVGTEHLLAAIMESSDPKIKQIFTKLNIPEASLIQQVSGALKSDSKLPDLTEMFKTFYQKDESNDEESDSDITQNSLLEVFGINLTSDTFQKKVDPVIGRENEIMRIIQILSRRTKNNPLILGEPGVGKTAIVEGLAKKIINGDVPEALLNKKIYALDMAALVAGTIYRGEFENRIKQIIEEVKARPNVILFIDEIHNIVGAGAAAGSMDAANILKPSLARGEIRCIGATTYHDYRKSIENDPALERRFQPIKIEEPSAEEAKMILSGIKTYFESFHGVRIEDNAIMAAVDLSQKYLPEKFLPDKAIDLIDEASASVKILAKPSPLQKKARKLEAEIVQKERMKNKTIIKEDFDEALKLKEDIDRLSIELKELKSKLAAKEGGIIGQISESNIAKVVSKITGIPHTELLAAEKSRILALSKNLKKEIIGQDEPLVAISDYIKRAKAGLSNENRPLASFLLVGPSGVGKTYTAKILAKLLFNDEKALIRIDMSEYGEKFNISKLIGAPAGYVGYKESGQLTEKVKHKPYSIVLFDEVEKANPEVFDLLLQVLDDGYLTDAAGSKINFRNTIILMTSNIGTQIFKKSDQIGFGNNQSRSNLKWAEEKIMQDVRNHFKIEFLNRLDQIIFFSPLSVSSLEKIALLELEQLSQSLARKNMRLTFTPEIAKILIAKDNEEKGVRAIKKTIRDMVETPLSQKILEEEINSGDAIHLSAKNGIIEIG
ncbi:MAG: ATP-dependent Clp protease ATP-binding subunit [Candidatus Buchananbacteria bacterium]